MLFNRLTNANVASAKFSITLKSQMDGHVSSNQAKSVYFILAHSDIK
jgi:hypothetical protein